MMRVYILFVLNIICSVNNYNNTEETATSLFRSNEASAKYESQAGNTTFVEIHRNDNISEQGRSETISVSNNHIRNSFPILEADTDSWMACISVICISIALCLFLIIKYTILDPTS